MSFDGVFLHKLIRELDILKTGRISKIFELTSDSFIFQVRANKENYNLLINLNANSSRVHISNKDYKHEPIKSQFALFLKKNIEGYFINDLYQYENDRILIFKLEGFSEMKDRNIKYLICEIMGKYSNLILTNNEYIILDSLHKDGISEFNRAILPNIKYEYPKNDKLNPYTIDKTTLYNILLTNDRKEILSKLSGISNTFLNNLFINEVTLDNFYNLLHNENSPITYYDNKNKLDFYFTSSNYHIKYDSYSLLLDDFYYELDKIEQIRRLSNDLLKFINRQINKYENKIKKLNEEIKEASASETYKLYGELLLSYPKLKDKLKEVAVYDYYNDIKITIPLEEKYNVIDNSQRYYKKYNKLKRSISFLNEQIDIALKELHYFKLLSAQTKIADLADIKEITEELIDNKYLPNNNKNKKKKAKPNIIIYKDENRIIYVGKNNIQNEYITHVIAKKNDYWFHIQNGPGSHVVISKDSKLTEDDIRTCANLAAIYSYYKDSNSVAVDYTLVKYIKKIPGQKNCFVRYTNQKTIYIDPDKSLLNNLKEYK